MYVFRGKKKKKKKKVEGRFSSEEVRGGIFFFFLTPRAIPIHKPRFKGAAAPPHRSRTYPWSLIIGIPAMDRGVTPQSGCPGQIISDSKLRNASKCTVDLITEADDRSMFRGLMIVRVG